MLNEDFTEVEWVRQTDQVLVIKDRCVGAWETLQNGFLATHVLLWWLAAAMWVVAVVIEGVRIRRRERDSREETR